MRSLVLALLWLCSAFMPVAVRAETPSDICARCGGGGYARPVLDDEGGFRAAMLGMHNAERAEWNVPPLKWSAALADDARAYAAQLARRGVLEHSSGLGGARPIGENLWMGTRGAYSYGEMVGSFLDERNVYVARAIPNISKTGRWSDAAHYSQIIWRTTTSVGCAVASGEDFDVLVCRYDPSGNIWGRTADDPRGFDAPATTRIASNNRVLRSR